ncbi:hypothetical protein PENTCL1PPCAC_3327, partial [Pristionchus entomophagus]
YTLQITNIAGVHLSTNQIPFPIIFHDETSKAQGEEENITKSKKESLRQTKTGFKGAAKYAWTTEYLQEALHAVSKGRLTVMQASRKFRIPSSTIYQARNKMQQEKGGSTIDHTKTIPKRAHVIHTEWNQTDLKNALCDIREGRLSVEQAFWEYDINPATLYTSLKTKPIEQRTPLQREKKTIAVREEVEVERTYTDEDLKKAIRLVRYDVLTMKDASLLYRIPLEI